MFKKAKRHTGIITLNGKKDYDVFYIFFIAYHSFLVYHLLHIRNFVWHISNRHTFYVHTHIFSRVGFFCYVPSSLRFFFCIEDKRELEGNIFGCDTLLNGSNLRSLVLQVYGRGPELYSR